MSAANLRPYFGGPSVHPLRVSLLGGEPTVWRRVMVASLIKLPKFNRVLETVMGWEGYHLHMFEIGDLRIGEQDDDSSDVIDERRITIEQILPRVGSELTWTYDFGDDWTHEVIVEAIEEPSPDVTYPVCTGGERACPPEDCGGIHGYQRLVEAIADPTDEEHDEFMTWVPAGFDPAVFDMRAANQHLRRVR